MPGALSYSPTASNSQPVGSIVQAPYNLIDTNYLPCDGRAVSRSQYPLLSACLPNIGTFTATARTKPAVPTSSAIAANGSVWVVTGATATNNLHTTPDGITYTARTTPVSSDVRSILYDGTNFVAAQAAGGPGTLYSSDGGVTWTATVSTSATLTAASLQTGMTWAPTLGTVGRFCMASNGSSFYTSDDRGVTWTARAHGLGGNAFHVCWTGQKFIATVGAVNVIYTSADGITWASQALKISATAATANSGPIISDGNGRVLWLDADTAYIDVSLDHGVTWFKRLIGVSGTYLQLNSNAAAWYTNGKFFVSGANFQLWASTDLVGWVNIAMPSGLTNYFAISYKAGVYFMTAQFNTTGAFTAVEDTSTIQLPGPAQGGSTNTWNNFMPFIKVK